MWLTVSQVLTPRQWQIVESLIHGATANEVARELGLSVNTIQTQIKRIYAKLDVSTRVELVRWVLLSQRVTNSGD